MSTQPQLPATAEGTERLDVKYTHTAQLHAFVQRQAHSIMERIAGSDAKARERIEVVRCSDRIKDEIETLGMLLHLVCVLGDDHFIGPQALGVLDLVGRGREQHRMGAEGMGELDAHMTKAAQTDDADLHAWADLPVA